MSEALLAKINSIPWYQSIDLGDGIITPGSKSLAKIKREQRTFFDPLNLDGATFLDIGAWAGAHAFEAKRRGAARVLALDHYVWTHPHWRGREAFDLVNERLGPIEAKELDIHQISPDAIGLWNVVLFAGVLYHLTSPLDGLRRAASVAHECLIVETRADWFPLKKPKLSYHPGASLKDDPTNFFTPNRAFIIEVLREVGFVSFATKWRGHRLTIHAWRSATRKIR